MTNRIYQNITSANEAYKNYVWNHQVSILRGFHKYGKTISDILGLDIEEKIALEANLDSHDASKLSDEEFYAYRDKFYSYSGMDQSNVENKFERAWLHHYQCNPHHPEHWVYINTDTETMQLKILDMPDIYIAEMILDWIAMGYQFNSKVYDWYDNNKYKIPLSINTANKVNVIMSELKKFDDNNPIPN